MPAKSPKQLKFIFAKRNQYKSKKKTPKSFKWVWGKEWAHLESIMSFDEFNQTHPV